MDFHSLPRRSLQALCKRNRIPANITNVAMADALRALDNVEGLDELQQEASFLSPKKGEALSPALPVTGRRTSARQRVTRDDTLASAPVRTRRAAGMASEIKRVVVVEGGDEEKQDGGEEMPEIPLDKGSPLPRSRRVMAKASAVKSIAFEGGEEEGAEKIPETPAAATGRRTRGTSTRRGAGKKEEKEGQGGVEMANTPAARRNASAAQDVVVDPVVLDEEKEEQVVSVRTARRTTRQSSRRQTEEVLGSGLVATRRSTRKMAAVKMVVMAQEEQDEKDTEVYLVKKKNENTLRDSSAEVEESCITLNPEAAEEDGKEEGDHYEIQSNLTQKLDREIEGHERGSIPLPEVENPEAEDKEFDDKHGELLLESDSKGKDGQHDQKAELEAQHEVKEGEELLEKAEGSNMGLEVGEQNHDLSLESADIALFKTEAEEYKEEAEGKIPTWGNEGPENEMPSLGGQMGSIASAMVEGNLEQEDGGSKQREEDSEVCESDDSPIKGLVVTSEGIAEEATIHNHESESVEPSADIEFNGTEEQTIKEMGLLDETFGDDAEYCSQGLLANLAPPTEDSSEPESGLEVGADALAKLLDIAVSEDQNSSVPEVLNSNQLVIDNLAEQTTKEAEPSDVTFGEETDYSSKKLANLAQITEGSSELESGLDAASPLSVDIAVSTDQISPGPETVSLNQQVIDNKVEQTTATTFDTVLQADHDKTPNLTVDIIADSLASLKVNESDVNVQCLDATKTVALSKSLDGNVMESDFVVSDTKEEGSEEGSLIDKDKENKAMVVKVKAKKQIVLEELSLRKLKSLYKEELDSKNNDNVEVKRAALTVLNDNWL